MQEYPLEKSRPPRGQLAQEGDLPSPQQSPRQCPLPQEQRRNRGSPPSLSKPGLSCSRSINKKLLPVPDRWLLSPREPWQGRARGWRQAGEGENSECWRQAHHVNITPELQGPAGSGTGVRPTENKSNPCILSARCWDLGVLLSPSSTAGACCCAAPSAAAAIRAIWVSS